MRSLIPALVALPLLAGCPKSQPMGSSDTPILKKRSNPFEESQNLGMATATEVDINADGVVDQRLWHNMSGVLIRREVDLNLDGEMDVFTRFNSSGQIEREDMDGDFDGRIDWVDYYRNGERVRSVADTDYDGQPDAYNTYKEGRLILRERDTNGDGQLDFQERYDANGVPISDAVLLESSESSTEAESGSESAEEAP